MTDPALKRRKLGDILCDIGKSARQNKKKTVGNVTVSDAKIDNQRQKDIWE